MAKLASGVRNLAANPAIYEAPVLSPFRGFVYDYTYRAIVRI